MRDSQALAMERAAQEVGWGGKLKYACPANCGPEAFNNSDAMALGPQLYVDIHDGGNSILVC